MMDMVFYRWRVWEKAFGALKLGNIRLDVDRFIRLSKADSRENYYISRTF